VTEVLANPEKFPINIILWRNIMFGQDFLAKSDKIFANLLTLANEELGSKGVKIEPSIIVDRIIPPLKDLYLKNLIELLESFLEQNP